MSKPNVILLYGFAGIGKTTVAERYIQDNPLSVSLEADRIVPMIGQWANHEPEAWGLVFKLSQAMIAACVEEGHDVVVPFMPRGAHQLAGFEQTARGAGARFVEISLTADRDNAIKRLVRRGTWGEEGAPPITPGDLPVINELYDGMETALDTRPAVIEIPSIENDRDAVYKQFLQVLGQT
jgi:predicted kinase